MSNPCNEDRMISPQPCQLVFPLFFLKPCKCGSQGQKRRILQGKSDKLREPFLHYFGCYIECCSVTVGLDAFLDALTSIFTHFVHGIGLISCFSKVCDFPNLHMNCWALSPFAVFIVIFFFLLCSTAFVFYCVFNYSCLFSVSSRSPFATHNIVGFLLRTALVDVSLTTSTPQTYLTRFHSQARATSKEIQCVAFLKLEQHASV